MPKIKDSSTLVEEFLLELVPGAVVEAVRILANLDYPIPDKKTLIHRLSGQRESGPQEQPQTDQDKKQRLSDQIAKMLEPEDFGIDSPRSALEKFFARLTQRREFLPLPLPLGPVLPPDLSGAPDEPLPSPPLFTTFGSDPCGRAAAQLWREHVERFEGTVFGPSPAYYDFLKEREDRCSSVRMRYPGPCGGAGQLAYARCFILGGSRDECAEQAAQAIARCRRFESGDRFGVGDPEGRFGF